MPGKSFVERPESVSAHFQSYLRQRLLKQSDALNLTILDLAGHLQNFYEREGIKLFHPHEGHLNSEGHRAVADFLAAKLQESS
jgi:hypothetical protein